MKCFSFTYTKAISCFWTWLTVFKNSFAWVCPKICKFPYSFVEKRKILYFVLARNLITKLFFNTHNESFLFAALNMFVLGAARHVAFRLVGCLRRNGFAGCWDGSVLLDLWGMCSKSPCSFVCRERSDARIDIVNFWGDMKWCLWKACACF